MKPVPSTLRGIVRGSTIVLDTDPGLPEGQTVAVILRTEAESISIQSRANELPQGFGSWADEAEALDEFLEDTRQRRKLNRKELEH